MTASESPLLGRQMGEYLKSKRMLKAWMGKKSTDTAGIALLNSVLTAGLSNSQAQTSPACIPTPMQIEFIITLLVHPFYTSNRLPEDSPEISSGSLTFLKALLSIVGPGNANFGAALNFSPSALKNTRRSRFNASEDVNSDIDEERESMNNVLASRESIRNRAVDFWHAVGWAFNCSIRYPERWTYWKTWLEFMLDVLESDWAERERHDHEAHALMNDLQGEYEFSHLGQSLLVSYFAEARRRSAGTRRIIKSTFANGDYEALKAFPAVFENEERSNHKRKFAEDRGHCRLNIQDDEDDIVASQGPAEEVGDMDEEEVARASTLGGMEAVHLRQRFLGILSRASMTLPEILGDGLEVYRIYVDCITTLPLPGLSLFITPSMDFRVLPEVFCSLDQMLLVRLMPSGVRRPKQTTDSISQDTLEEYYLPHCAHTTSIVDNAKFSILIESLLRLFLVADCALEYTPSLVEAVETGIKAREKKAAAKIDRRKKVNTMRREAEEVERMWLETSGQRLREILAYVREQQELT
ncbi:hypothetical protein BP6252_09877 [Coleophoma cylindrospora]|uniref:Uncharacterized protein n=1 Tax=Coleophoma cylindrospora TaxID=1849047 RepID=A0A3D8QWS4_9HELO|nr:hypothetical protein BP6252_09877 [Coleophoma cylindrospora]